MGAKSSSNSQSLKEPPGIDEFEITLLGPGYGESIVLHIGNGAWIVVDSCSDKDGMPRSLRYLENIGVEPAQSVSLIVATHWHDDHIRGIHKLVEVCENADFCCSSALCGEEFLTVADALAKRPQSISGSGLNEIYRVLSRLVESGSPPIHAIASRRIYSHGGCEVWSLSPSDAAFRSFLGTIGNRIPAPRKAKTRYPAPSPNDIAVALWVEVGNIAVLLGSDLERARWLDVLQDQSRPSGKASAFKIPHHGATSSHAPGVWDEMLDPDPFAALAPWRKGGKSLPTQIDVQRIRTLTPNAWASAKLGPWRRPSRRYSGAVAKTIRESSIELRRTDVVDSLVRMRRPIHATRPWGVEEFGSACHLDSLVS